MKRKSAALALVPVVALGVAGCGAAAATPKTTSHAPAVPATPVTITPNAMTTTRLTAYYRQHGQTLRQAEVDAAGSLEACQNMTDGEPITTATSMFASISGARAQLVGDTIVKLCLGATVTVRPFAPGESYDTMPAVPTQIALRLTP